MAITAEAVFRESVALAEGTRQQTKAAAMVTYGYVAANLAAYITALSAADDAYQTAVTAARLTAALPLGLQAHTGPIPHRWGSMVGMY